MTRYQLLGIFAALGAISLNVSSAHAQSCNATTDCPKNYLCSVVGATAACSGGGTAGSTSVGTATPVSGDAGIAPADSAGSGGASNAYKVPATGGSTTTPMPLETGGSTSTTICTSSAVIKQCVPLACTSDSVCATGWSCQTETTTSCATSASAGGAAGISAPRGSGNAPSNDAAGGGSATAVPIQATGGSPSDCIANTQSTCKPKAQNPCVIDEDCGPGYDCVDNTTCVCSASGSVAVGGSGGAASAGTDNSAPIGAGAARSDTTSPSCVCGPSGTARCQARTIACQTRVDCPETWTCLTAAESGAASAGGATSTSPNTGATASTTPAPDTTTAGNCLAPYDYYRGNGSYSGDAGVKTAVDNSSGSTNSSAGGGSSTGPVAPAGDSTEQGTAATPASNANTGHSGGCQISRGQESRFAAVIIGLMAAFGLRRRRQVI